MLSCIILLDSVLYRCKIYILRDAQIGTLSSFPKEPQAIGKHMIDFE